MSTFERIVTETADGIETITLNRPEKRNALDERTISELRVALAEAEADDTVKVIVLRGAGPDFCAGADLAQLERIAGTSDPLENLEDASSLGELLIQMRQLQRPIIAAVHGNVFAGGAGLATACDLVIAADTAKLSYTEVRLGFVPAMVMALLKRIVGEKIAFELCVFGHVLSADEAHKLGIFNRVAGQAQFDQDVGALARELAARSPSAVRLIKRLMYDSDGMTFEQAIRRGAEVNTLARMTPDCREGVQKFLESRKKK